MHCIYLSSPFIIKIPPLQAMVSQALVSALRRRFFFFWKRFSIELHGPNIFRPCELGLAMICWTLAESPRTRAHCVDELMDFSSFAVFVSVSFVEFVSRQVPAREVRDC